MWTNKLFVIASCVTILSLLLSSCAPAAAPVAPQPTIAPAKPETQAPSSSVTSGQPAATPKPVADQPRSGGILDRVISEDSRSFDLHQESSLSVHLPIAPAYSGLVKYDSVVLDKVVPDLAESWEASPDGTIWTFRLRKDARWHDGKPFTVDDAKFSLQRMAFWKDFKIVSPRAGALLMAVKAVDAVDANTVRVTLKYPSASFLNNVAGGWILMLPKHVIEAKGDMKNDVVGTGPFRWKTYSRGATMELAKNPEYFVKGRPYLDGVRFFIVTDTAARLAAFRTGRVKMTFLATTALTHADAELVRKEMANIATVETHRAFTYNVLLLKVTKAPWNDVRVRKAIDLAYDRQAAIKLNFNMGNLGAAMDPKGAWGIPEEEMSQRPGYRQPKDADVAEAKRLLAEAGYPNGFKTSMMTRSGRGSESVAVLAQNQLAKIGIEAEVDVKERVASEGLLARGAFEVSPSLLSHVLDDPDVTLGLYYTSDATRNYGGFADKQIDEMAEKQARTIDTNERKKMVRQIQERLLEVVPYPVVYWEVYNMAYWKEVRGYKQAPGVFSHNTYVDVWLAK